MRQAALDALEIDPGGAISALTLARAAVVSRGDVSGKGNMATRRL